MSKHSSEVLMLKEMLTAYGIEVSEEQGELLLRHLELVIEKNKMLNLTRIVDWHEGLIKHVVDSLLVLNLIPFDRSDSAISFVDIGTGAGFPGVPLCVTTNWDGSLIDSIQKKAAAVNEFIEELELCNAHMYGVRVEDFAREHSGCFDLVVARAVADTSVLMEYASPLLQTGGYLCVSKGSISIEESEHAEIVSEKTGFDSVSRETLFLPEDMGERTLLLYQKTRDSEVKLPRRTGMALKRPLYTSK